MKPLPLLVCFAVFSAGLAQKPPKDKDYYAGTLTYPDGRTTDGYINCPFEHKEKKIKFIPFTGTDMDTSIVDSDQLRSVSFTTQKATYRFDHLRIAGNKEKPFREKYWLYFDAGKSCPALSCYLMGTGFDIDRRGELKLTLILTRDGAGGSSASGSPSVDYYLKKSNEENANMIDGKAGDESWHRIFKNDPEILKRMKEGKYTDKEEKKSKRKSRGENKTEANGEEVQAVAKDYCDLHAEK